VRTQITQQQGAVQNLTRTYMHAYIHTYIQKAVGEDADHAAAGGCSESDDRCTTNTTNAVQEDAVYTKAREPPELTPSEFDNTPALECCVVNANETQTATVIWLHGQGDLAEHFAELPSALTAPWCKFIFPNAPLPGCSWFDSGDTPEGVGQAGGSPVRGPSKQTSFSESMSRGLAASALAICKVIRDENKKGIPTRRIMLAGFGQGGVVATYSALSYGERLGGMYMYIYVCICMYVCTGQQQVYIMYLEMYTYICMFIHTYMRIYIQSPTP
jgi:predicted esterase